MDLTNNIVRRFGAQLLDAWGLGFHTKQPSHVAPGFKLSHLCPRGPLGIDGGTVDEGGDRFPPHLLASKGGQAMLPVAPGIP